MVLVFSTFFHSVILSWLFFLRTSSRKEFRFFFRVKWMLKCLMNKINQTDHNQITTRQIFKNIIILNVSVMQLHTFGECFSELAINRSGIVLITPWLPQTCLRCHDKLYKYLSKDALQTQRSERLSLWEQTVIQLVNSFCWKYVKITDIIRDNV